MRCLDAAPGGGKEEKFLGRKGGILEGGRMTFLGGAPLAHSLLCMGTIQIQHQRKGSQEHDATHSNNRVVSSVAVSCSSLSARNIKFFLVFNYLTQVKHYIIHIYSTFNLPMLTPKCPGQAIVVRVFETSCTDRPS